MPIFFKLFDLSFLYGSNSTTKFQKSQIHEMRQKIKVEGTDMTSEYEVTTCITEIDSQSCLRLHAKLLISTTSGKCNTTYIIMIHLAYRNGGIMYFLVYIEKSHLVISNILKMTIKRTSSFVVIMCHFFRV